MTNRSKLERAVDAFIAEMAENFAVENRGYDFHKDGEPFAVELKNCCTFGANSLKHLLLKALDRLEQIIEIENFLNPDKSSVLQDDCESTRNEILALLGSKEIE